MKTGGLLFAVATVACGHSIPEHHGHALHMEETRPHESTNAVSFLVSKAPNVPAKPWLNAGQQVLFIITPVSAAVGLAMIILLRRLEARHEENVDRSRNVEDGWHADMEVVEREPEELDEDVYGAGIATLVRDTYSFVDGKGELLLRVSRLPPVHCSWSSSYSCRSLSFTRCRPWLPRAPWLKSGKYTGGTSS